MRTRAIPFALAALSLLPVTATPADAQEVFTKKRIDPSKRPHFTNDPGRVWVVEPFALRSGKGNLSGGGGRGALCVEVLTDAAGSLRVFFAHAVPGPIPDSTKEPSPSFTAVAFDAQGRRHPLQLTAGVGRAGGPGGAFSMWHMGFALDPKVLAADRAAYLGIERVLDEPRRK